MRIATEEYNHRRYGRPWAAVCTDGGREVKLEFIKRAHVGGPGEAGYYELKPFHPGTVVALGRKDFRRPRSEYEHYVATEDGKLRKLPDMTKTRLLEMIRAADDGGARRAELEAEKRTLLLRLAEIDEEIKNLTPEEAATPEPEPEPEPVKRRKRGGAAAEAKSTAGGSRKKTKKKAAASGKKRAA